MKSDLPALLELLISGKDLSEQQAEAILQAMAREELSDALAGAILTALRVKGETGAEIRGFARGMRNMALRPSIAERSKLVDCVGTGGDGSGSLNLSTGSALLAAASGARVAKHGNRAMSSKSGSADVLEALGFELPVDGHAVAACLDATGFTFMFAPRFHAATKSVMAVRKSLGVRTVFNLLGPLVNPLSPPYMVVGAYSLAAARLMAEALSGMNIERVFVIHGEPGWDEATPIGPFVRLEVTPAKISERVIDPLDLGFARCQSQDLAGGTAAENADALRAVLTGAEQGAHRDALVLGAGLVLEVCGRAQSLTDGMKAASHALENGSAGRLLGRLRDFVMEAA
ncbi:MAG: anthranilate phosphoribosyltransferase [Gammaproteobacteria bacterium]|nr:anthranilate phosphoribosyltransferase [Gammaproteobacteria bacterium]